MSTVNLLVEGDADEAVVRRVVKHVGLAVGNVYSVGGTGLFDQRISKYNQAAHYSRWLAVRDLDRARCAVELKQQLLPRPSAQMIFRIAVRETEAWLLADRVALREFLKVPEKRVPNAPESILDPKRALVQLGMSSQSRDIREGMTPVRGAAVGREYVRIVREFASEHWRPAQAARLSESLHRCIRALGRWR